jgi:cation:H+ antiporter
MAATPPYRNPPQAYVLLVGFAATALIGLLVARTLQSGQTGLIAAACFSAVISAAMVISWGAEAAQFFISQGFAVAIIALLQVLPEFMVEAVIAWRGDVKNMLANATGSNRLLIGLGWPLIFFTADITSRIRHGRGVGAVVLRSVNVVEMLSLLIASSYYLKLLATGALTVVDGVLLVGMYATYMIVLSRLPEEEEEGKEDLVSPARLLAEIKSPVTSRLAVLGTFLIGGVVMAFVSAPFVDSLKQVAAAWGVSEFAFIQWVAPFLSEFPEKATAVNWSLKIRLAPMAMINMISSTVSQYTLLVGMIPLVYATSFWVGNIHEVQTLHGLPIVPMVTRLADGQLHDLRVEVFLSWAMTLLGCAQLAKMRITPGNAATMLVIWLAQFLAGPLETRTGIPAQTQRWGEGIVCVVLAVIEVLRWRHQIHLARALQQTAAHVAGRPVQKLSSDESLNRSRAVPRQHVLWAPQERNPA